MEKIIKNKNLFNTMIKKVMLSFVMVFMLMFSANAVNMYNSIDHQTQIDEINKVNYQEVDSYLYLSFTNSTLNLREGRNYNIAPKPLIQYVIYNNNNIEKEFNFITLWKTNDLNQTQIKYHNLNISGGSSVQVLVQPSVDYEYISTQVYCVDPSSSTCGAGYQVHEYFYVEQKDGINSVFTPLINGVVDLITINLSIWKTLFYVFITLLVLGSLGGIIWGGRKWYEWTDKHHIWKKKRSNHK